MEKKDILPQDSDGRLHGKCLYYWDTSNGRRLFDKGTFNHGVKVGLWEHVYENSSNKIFFIT